MTTYTSTVTISCTPKQLKQILAEIDQTPPNFTTAAELGLNFRGGLDHAVPQKNGWGVKLIDRGCNGSSRHFVFRVPVTDRLISVLTGEIG